MSTLTRHLRGIGIAAVVLTLSAGAVFASTAAFPVRSTTPTAEQPTTEEPTEATETEAPETEEPSEDAQTTDTTDSATAPQDTHGALVSAAAQMDTPAGFANHGQFVSCVAHMQGVTLATIDWTTVTPDTCAAASGANTNTKAEAGKAKGAAGRAKGAAHRAAAQAGH